MSISALPTPPTRQDPATFNSRADAFLAALPTFGTEANVLASDVNADKLAAAASVTSATTQANAASASAAAALASESAAANSATAAATAAGAALWVSGTTYAAGAVVYSPTTLLTYRRKTGGAGTTDPSADTTNWALAGTAAPQMFVVSATTVAMSANGHYVLTNASLTTATLPGSPTAGDVVWVTVANARTDNVIARNAQPIMGLAEDMTLDFSTISAGLRFVNGSLGWRIIS